MADGLSEPRLAGPRNPFSAVQSYHPITFLERGVAVPFTPPLLGGARARPAEKQGLELIIPNFTGGRGFYIVPWSDAAALCRPTLHDKELNARVAELKSVTPAAIRRVARGIASEGLAGEAAMQAARLATNADKDDRLVTNYQFLMRLIAQANVVPAARQAAESSVLERERHATLTTASVATHLGQSTAWVATALEALADVMQNFGLGAGATGGRIPRLVGMLRGATAEILQWSTTLGEWDQADARMVCTVADFTLVLADELLERSYGSVKDIIGLLRDWAADPAALVRLAARPEWLLDGWEQICLIWSHAQDDSERRAALVEIVGLIPVLPIEVYEWCSARPHSDMQRRFRRLVRANEDWRTGATIFNLIARNEKFRAATWQGLTERGYIPDPGLVRTAETISKELATHATGHAGSRPGDAGITPRSDQGE